MTRLLSMAPFGACTGSFDNRFLYRMFFSEGAVMRHGFVAMHGFLVILPVYDHVNDEFGNNNKLNFAGRFYFLCYDMDIDLLFLTGGSRTDRYGVDFSKIPFKIWIEDLASINGAEICGAARHQACCHRNFKENYNLTLSYHVF